MKVPVPMLEARARVAQEWVLNSMIYAVLIERIIEAPTLLCSTYSGTGAYNCIQVSFSRPAVVHEVIIAGR